MFKTRSGLFETNSSSTHSLTIIKNNNSGEIKENSTIALDVSMYQGIASTEINRLYFISNVIANLVEDYYDNMSSEYVAWNNDLYFSNEAFDALREVLKEERNVTLTYGKGLESMPYDDENDECSYHAFFGYIDMCDRDGLKERYSEYVKSMKEKIRDYIFGNYTFSSNTEEW